MHGWGWGAVRCLSPSAVCSSKSRRGGEHVVFGTASGWGVGRAPGGEARSLVFFADHLKNCLRSCPALPQNERICIPWSHLRETVFKRREYQSNLPGSIIEESQGEEVGDKTAHSTPVQLFPAHCSHFVLLFIFVA
jgi:hypothetical protein